MTDFSLPYAWLIRTHTTQQKSCLLTCLWIGKTVVYGLYESMRYRTTGCLYPAYTYNLSNVTVVDKKNHPIPSIIQMLSQRWHDHVHYTNHHHVSLISLCTSVNEVVSLAYGIFIILIRISLSWTSVCQSMSNLYILLNCNSRMNVRINK